MTETAQTPPPLEIDRIQTARSATGEIRLRLTGHWLDPQAPTAAGDELLVVHVEGRRHRFAPSHDEKRDGEVQPGQWSATFMLPVWAEPRQEGQAALWLGSSVIAIPVAPSAPLEISSKPPGEPVAPAAPLEVASQPVASPAPLEVPSEPPGQRAPAKPHRHWEPHTGRASAEPHRHWEPGSPEPARSGPLADLLLRETVAALHVELEQRTAEAARMHGALADSRSELDARNVTQVHLEATLAELRGEQTRLTEGVVTQRGELEERMSEAERDRAEFERRLAELAAASDERAAEVAALREQLAGAQATADQRAAEAIELREELAAANVSREAAISEAAGLRAELGRLGSELAVTRERVESESGDLGEANRLLTEARALADELRSGAHSS